MKRILPITAAVLGTVCIIYYILCGCLYSFTMSGLWIWLSFALIMYFGCLWKYIAEPKIGKRFIQLYKWLKGITLSAVALFLAVFLGFEILLGIQWCQGIGQESRSCDVVIVLGATVEYDRPGDALQKRIDTAYEIIKNNPDAVVITCGGLGEDDIVTEAECIRNELVSMGIDADRILTEEDSTSTAENFKYAAELIPDGAETVAVVTSGFHQFRALSIGSSAITEAELFPVSAPCGSLKLPRDMVREFAAFVKGYLSPKI